MTIPNPKLQNVASLSSRAGTMDKPLIPLVGSTQLSANKAVKPGLHSVGCVVTEERNPKILDFGLNSEALLLLGHLISWHIARKGSIFLKYPAARFCRIQILVSIVRHCKEFDDSCDPTRFVSCPPLRYGPIWVNLPPKLMNVKENSQLLHQFLPISTLCPLSKRKFGDVSGPHCDRTWCPCPFCPCKAASFASSLYLGKRRHLC